MGKEHTVEYLNVCRVRVCAPISLVIGQRRCVSTRECIAIAPSLSFVYIQARALRGGWQRLFAHVVTPVKTSSIGVT